MFHKAHFFQCRVLILFKKYHIRPISVPSLGVQFWVGNFQVYTFWQYTCVVWYSCWELTNCAFRCVNNRKGRDLLLALLVILLKILSGLIALLSTVSTFINLSKCKMHLSILCKSCYFVSVAILILLSSKILLMWFKIT